jgi:schlafen family protein
MLLKPLREIGLRDLEELIGNVAEGLQVDFKQAAVGKADAERKEFVADVTAFANASGGDIVFGIVEGPDAVASQVLGIPVADLDAEERRLAEIIRNGTEPRLSDFEFKWIDNPPNGHVLILRIGRSWRAPHRVTLAGHDRFYIRNARGKHPMNTDELRTAFTRGQALEDRIAQFQRARIDLIAERQGPVDMGGGPKLVVHALPLVSFADPPAVQFRYGEVLQSPLGGGSYNQMHTLEGPVTYGFRGTTISRYTLHFRNGILEGVTDCASDIQTSSIPLTPVEATIARAVSDHLKYWNEKGIGPPYFLFVSILFAEGYLGISGSMWSEEGVRVKRRHLLLPSQVITQSEGIHIGTLLRPTFDLLWNGFGYSSSVNFDERGRYRVQR